MTPDPASGLAALIERVEAGERSRELEMDIYHAVVDPTLDADRARRYFRSLDAARSLVPDNWQIMQMMLWKGEPATILLLETEFDRRLSRHVHSNSITRKMRRVEAAAETGPACLVLAALRARAAGR